MNAIFWLIPMLIIGTIIIVILINLRRVVPTNEVHIVQRKSSSTVHGRWFKWSNVYISWPSWVPMFWVDVRKLPLSIFTLQLEWYKAYDSWKVPFMVDITAFFVIKDPEVAAQKIFNISELKTQLNEILKWVVRKTLASKDIIEIMESRVEIKDEFYNEVFSAVKDWWVDLKNVEFMDIRDPGDETSKVISNIMQKKRSQIESESQIEVAENQKNAIIEKENKDSEARARAAEAKSKADIVEYDSRREADLKRIENERMTENLEIEKEKVLSMQKEEAKQKLYESTKITREKELAIRQLEEEKRAEINKNIELIKADEQRQKALIEAESESKTIEMDAEANKKKVELEAQAEKSRIESIWLAEAKKIDYMWSAEAKNKTEMAKALNEFSPEALNFMIKEIEAKLTEVVDLEKAKALSKADIKVISTWENGWSWVKNFMDLFSANWWANIWAMVENFKNTVWEDKANEIMEKVWVPARIIKNFTKKTETEWDKK